jgi:hypothetical protein
MLGHAEGTAGEDHAGWCVAALVTSSTAQDLVGGALLAAGHGQLLSAGTVPDGPSWLVCGGILTHQSLTHCQAADTGRVRRLTRDRPVVPDWPGRACRP